MKLSALLEAPIFHDSELYKPDDTIKMAHDSVTFDDFKKNYTRLKSPSKSGIFGLHRSGNLAIAGIPNAETQSLRIVAEVTLRDGDEAFYADLEDHNVVSINTVQVARDVPQGEGWGGQLYAALIESGYVIVSDYAQYRGGKALWEKLVRMSQTSNFKVYIMNDGKFMLDANGNPIRYNGKNIPANDIWTTKKNDERYERIRLVAMKG